MKKKFPRISTRGYFDLYSGSTIKTKSYFLYPKHFFENLKPKELTIMIHGMRNDNTGAVTKFEIAKKRLQSLGYKHPVVGFSYDANTRGAHLKRYEKRAIRAAELIAEKNGQNLSQFIIDFKKSNPTARIRLMGHSLGSNVIQSTVKNLAKKSLDGIITGVYLFGASIPSNSFSPREYGKYYRRVVEHKIINYYSPTDEVLKFGADEKLISAPIGLVGATGKTISKYYQKKVSPDNHRFISYSKVLKKFP